MKYVYRVILCFAIPIVGLKLATCGAADRMERSVDCINDASSEIPYEVCAVPEWRALHDEIMTAFDEARALYDGSPFTQRALDDVHAAFLEGRMYRPRMTAAAMEIEGPPDRSFQGALTGMAAIAPDINAPEIRMRRYLRFLRALSPPRAGIEGRWINADGELRINATAARITINETGADAKSCTIHVRASAFRNRIRIDDAPLPAWRKMLSSIGLQLGPDKPLSGWALQAERRGAVLDVSEDAPDGASGSGEEMRPFCGGSDSLAGAYFPAR